MVCLAGGEAFTVMLKVGPLPGPAEPLVKFGLAAVGVTKSETVIVETLPPIVTVSVPVSAESCVRPFVVLSAVHFRVMHWPAASVPLVRLTPVVPFLPLVGSVLAVSQPWLLEIDHVWLLPVGFMMLKY